MATKLRKPKVDPGTLYRCVASFSYGSKEHGIPLTIVEGQRYRGTDEPARLFPHYFVRDDEGDAGAMRAKAALMAESQVAAAASREADTGRTAVSRPIPEKRRLQVRRDYVLADPGAGSGYIFRENEVWDSEDPVVKMLRKQDRALFKSLFEAVGE